MRRRIWLSCCPWLWAIASIASASINRAADPSRHDARSLSSVVTKVSNETLAITPRIVGGEIVTSLDNFPYYVHGIDGDLCGGSLIHPEVVLTAAHCTKAFNTSVIVRTLDWRGNDGTSEFYPIEFNFPHPDYTPGPEVNDIMLIKLSTPVVNAQLVELHRNDTLLAAGTEVTIMGFGLTYEGGPISADLRQVNVEIVEQSICQMLLPGLVVDDIHICAGYPQGGQDSCSGDSGGPLVYTQDATSIQYAIVSFGIGCARPNLPGVYTRVNSYIDWIDDFLCNQTDNPPLGCPITTSEGSPVPTDRPSENPISQLSPSPLTSFPTPSPSVLPSPIPSESPSQIPSDSPSLMPSQGPSLFPSAVPSQVPSLVPSTLPSLVPSFRPSNVPTALERSIPAGQREPGPPSIVSDFLGGSPVSSTSQMDAKLWCTGCIILLLMCYY